MDTFRQWSRKLKSSFNMNERVEKAVKQKFYNYFFLLPTYGWYKLLCLNFLLCKPEMVMFSTSVLVMKMKFKNYAQCESLCILAGLVSSAYPQPLYGTSIFSLAQGEQDGCMEKSPLDEFSMIPMEIPTRLSFWNLTKLYFLYLEE